MSRAVRLSALLLLLPACLPDLKGDEEGVDGDEGEVGSDEDPCVDDEPVATARMADGRTCEIPTDCVSMAEAWDRGWLALSSTSSGLVMEHVGPAEDEICMDGWYMVSSEDSQDAGLGDPGDGDDGDDPGAGSGSDGEDGGGSGSDGGGDGDGGDGEGGDGGGSGGDDGDLPGDPDNNDDPCDDDDDDEQTAGGHERLRSSEALVFGYAGGGAGLTPDLPSWWCIEKTQVTTTTDNIDFIGAHLPGPLAWYATTETDLDDDGVEDHADTDAGQYQTNLNIWDHMDTRPVFSIGRVRNYVELTPGQEAGLELVVTNMGRRSGTAMVEEVLPHGVEAVDFELEPDEQLTDARGRTVLRWEVSLGAAIDTDSYSHTDYDALHIGFTVQMREDVACPLRREGRMPTARWADADGLSWMSNGSRLVVSCCATDELDDPMAP